MTLCKHDFTDEGICNKCGYDLYATDSDKAWEPLITTEREVIRIFIELRKKLTDDIDEAMNEVLKLEGGVKK